MQWRYRKIYLGLLAGSAILATNAGAQDDVPAGFENLMQAQQTVIDVYLHGRYLTSTDASFTPSHIEFLQLQTLMKAMRQLPAEHAEKIRQAISGELEANQGLVCATQNQSGCGILQPDIAGVIFDESRFRADLFINPNYLGVQDNRSNEFLPRSDAGLSLLQNFGAAYAGSDSGNDYTIFGNTLFSYAESSVQAAWDVSGNNGARIDTLFYQHDFEGREFKAGLIKPHNDGLSFAPSQSIAGFRWSSSQQTRAGDLTTQSSAIQVFLNSRAQVDILKDGRLLSSEIYQPGNQLLNTERLPAGAYNITLRISEDNGQVRSEQRYFVKEFDLPPSDYVDYFIEAGNTLSERQQLLPGMNGDALLRAGFRYRLRDDMGLGLAASWTGNTVLLENSLIHVGPTHRLKGSLLWSNEGDYGYAINQRLQWQSLSVTLESRRLWRENNNPTAPVQTNINDPLQLLQASPSFELLPNAFTQHQLSLSLPLADGSLAYNATHSRQLGTKAQTIQSLSYARSMRFSGVDNISFRAALSHDGQEGALTLGINYHFQSKRWSHSLNPEVSSGSKQGNSLRWRSSRSFKDRHGADYRSAVYASTGDTNNLGFDGSYASNYGRANLTLEQGLQGNGSSRVFAHASSSFITDFDTIAWGGRDLAGSALLIHTEGDVRDMQFDILVNGNKQGSTNANTQSVLQLTPFDTYKIRLRPRGKTLIGMDEREQEITLYPGNVVPLVWQVSPIIIAYGRLLDTDGNAIANASIEGTYGVALTDDRGIFQAELLQSSETLSVNNKEYACRIVLPEIAADASSSVHNFGELVCEN
jgi:hypothetical protein